ncbi:uncharacterized protein LOC135342630 [Halichondria panicea]|uniref:uncharacterized protein LOC135342630 n=1 Tax=Halichondria panicea TaxID=6063 RepID=UPI00312B8434
MANSFNFTDQPTLITYPGAERDSQRDKINLTQDASTITEKSRHTSLAAIGETDTPWNQPKDKLSLIQDASTNIEKSRHISLATIEETDTPWNQPKDKLSLIQDASTNIEKSRHISLATIEETDTPWNQIRSTPTTETTIKENMLKHKEPILASINPKTLFGLYTRYGLSDIEYKSRKKKVNFLFETVVNNNAFSEFLEALERDKEHMGHQYIISLLQGTPFETKEDIDKSKMLLDQINKHADDAVEFLNVDDLNIYLCSAELLTNEESKKFTINTNTSQEKARLLLTILKTKGPTAHYIFVYKCLAKEKEHLGHAELYTMLTGESAEDKRRLNRKRKASIEDICTQPPKRYPNLLETPSGLKENKYLEEIRIIRKYHLMGRRRWGIAEDIYQSIMDSEDYVLEIKIAVLLESCTMYITNKESEVVLARVKLAENMSKQLHKQKNNVDMLEGRCEWVKAKLYRYTKQLDKAEEHITVARSKIWNCEEGEEKALVSYCYACILLSKPDRTLRDEGRAIDDLHEAIRCARQGESESLKKGKYGLDSTHCKLRLAQAYVGSSTGNTGKDVGEVSQENIAEATRIMKEIKQNDLEYRQKCMYLYTSSDVWRVGGNKTEAVKCAQEAFALAQKHNFNTEKDSAKLRLERLSEAS